MKRIIAAIIVILAYLPVMAQEGRGAIQVRLKDNNPLTVVIDGRHYRRYGNTLTIGNLPEGRHELKVYRFYPSNDARYRDFGYNRSHARLVYRGKIRVEAGRMYYCSVDPQYNTMNVRESGMVALEGDAGNYPIRSESVFSDSPNAIEEQSGRGIAYPEQINLLKATQMEALRQSVVTKPGDLDKLKQMQQYLEHRSMESAQVVTMLEWLNFESTRLEFAKWAYSKVVDQDNYHLVSGKLEYADSKEALEQSISGK
jgi:hypothetical protein